MTCREDGISQGPATLNDAAQASESSLRDHLALDRTRLANERTLLAYARTALMLMASGGTVLKFFGDSAVLVGSGWALLVLGVALAGFGATRFRAMRKSLRA